MIDVVVVGSLHLDIMVAAPRLPTRDETLMGSGWHHKCGGKGGNQALAAAQFGARVAFGGRTGADDFGRTLHANLAANGVDLSHLGTDTTLGSGISVAIVEAQGEYSAVVVSGANLGIEASKIALEWAALWSCKVLLLQNEVPEAVNLAAARAAKARGALIVLNAAPARFTAAAMLDLVDVLVVNRVEAAMLSGCGDDLAAALAKLHAPSRDVIVTRGGDDILLATRASITEAIPVLPVKLVSSHGAGDCFCGALSARLAAGDSIGVACRYALTAAGLFVSVPEAVQGRISDEEVVEKMNSGIGPSAIPTF